MTRETGAGRGAAWEPRRSSRVVGSRARGCSVTIGMTMAGNYMRASAVPMCGRPDMGRRVGVSPQGRRGWRRGSGPLSAGDGVRLGRRGRRRPGARLDHATASGAPRKSVVAHETALGVIAIRFFSPFLEALLFPTAGMVGRRPPVELDGAFVDCVVARRQCHAVAVACARIRPIRDREGCAEGAS